MALPVPIDVAGAGTRTIDGQPMLPQAMAQLAARGIDASGFRSRALTENGVIQADLVLTATREHRSPVLERVRLALKRSFTLLEFAALMDAQAGMTPPSPQPDPDGAAMPRNSDAHVVVRRGGELNVRGAPVAASPPGSVLRKLAAVAGEQRAPVPGCASRAGCARAIWRDMDAESG